MEDDVIYFVLQKEVNIITKKCKQFLGQEDLKK